MNGIQQQSKNKQDDNVFSFWEMNKQKSSSNYTSPTKIEQKKQTKKD
jgi:hypothetical protein